MPTVRVAERILFIFMGIPSVIPIPDFTRANSS
jgi:hypothetical protein